ncbi:MAG: NnrU family protein [Mariprofundaceae bacterium]|nr:NnrU family protein [Mariprofundaceae bacterium]
METMILGLAIFFSIHLLPSVPPLRNALFKKLGEKPYRGIYALVSLTGLVLVVIGMGETGFVAVWEPPKWSYMVTNLSMLVALYCLVAMHMQSNLKRFTAHPMLWGITFWSGGHLMSNGDQASIVLFGSFLVYSLVAMASANLRGARPAGKKISLRYDAMIAVISTVAYVGLANLHLYFAGVELIR